MPTSRVKVSLTTAMLFLLAACSDLTTVTSDAPQPSLSVVPSTREGLPDYNERMALLADRLPGYAGHFLNDAGQLVVRVKQGRSTLAEARVGVADFIEEGVWGPPAQRAAARLRASNLQMLTADYDFRQLYDWFQLIVPSVRTLEGFKLLDVDERENRIKVVVQSAEAIPVARAAIDELPVPEAAVIFRTSPGAIVPLSQNLNDRVRPVIGGLEINGTGGQSCTLGFNAKRVTDGTYHLLTAAHCLDPVDDVTPPDNVYQDAGSQSGDYIAYESYDSNLIPCGPEACMNADVAAARYDGAPFSFGQVAFPSYQSTVYSSVRYIVSACDVEQSDTVVMVGRTSGTGVGFVTSTCAYPNYSNFPNVLCVFEADMGQGGGGDSGGPIIDEIDSPDYSASGIISGGDGSNIYFTPWSKIVNELSGSWCVYIDCAPDPYAYIVSGPTTVPPEVM